MSLGKKLKRGVKVGEKRSRKTRSDKKNDCKPFVSISFYDSLSNLSRIAARPVKDVGETFLITSLSDINVIEHFEEQFVFDYWHGDTVFMGNGQMIHKQRATLPFEKRRLNMRFNSEQYHQLKQFANAIDRSISFAASQLLEVAFFKTNMVHRYIETHVVHRLDIEQRTRLKEVLRFINEQNTEYETTYFGLLEHIFSRFKGSGMKHAIGQFLDKYYS